MHLEYFITDFDYHLKLWRNNLDSLQTFLLSCACRKNMISPYSPAQIGNQVPSNILATRQQFQRESKIVLDYLKDSHHARKLSHMQVNYPSTVSNLGRLSGRESARTEPQVRRAESKYHDLETIRYKEFVNTLQANISREFEINQKKRAFNRSVGTKSVAYEVRKTDYDYVQQTEIIVLQ